MPYALFLDTVCTRLPDEGEVGGWWRVEGGTRGGGDEGGDDEGRLKGYYTYIQHTMHPVYTMELGSYEMLYGATVLFYIRTTINFHLSMQHAAC